MAAKTLIIVESPAKSHTISKYLGDGFEVMSSMGHVRDLPQAVLGIDVKNGFKPNYFILPDKKKTIESLKKSARSAARVFIASDPDREGEAIAFHLQEILKEVNQKIFRILFHEITKSAIIEAIGHAGSIDMDKVQSQQMRRLLDRLAGYKISPILQRKIGGPLSAGRVQSIALKLIVEREKEIRAFVPEEYWTVDARLEGSQPPPFTAKLEKAAGKTVKIANQEACDSILADLKDSPYLLDKVKTKEKKRKAPPPLITSSLQQEAFRKFKYPVKRTMQIAQELYEGIAIGGEETTGLITYMRTDSYRISPQAAQEAHEFIAKTYGPQYIPDKPNVFRTKGKSQDAHECIRPTSPFHPPADLKAHLNSYQLKVYQLIWDRFLASQMADADILETQLHIRNGQYLFISKGEVIQFDGFQSILKPDSHDPPLPRLQEGETLHLHEIEGKQNFTKPAARYSEASLVKVLEEKGIGRPSTYAKIIETLGKRDYVFQEEKRFVPTDLGIVVVGYLEENFSDIMNYDFTANLEKQLDLVSEGKLEWAEGIAAFYTNLEKDLERVKDSGKVNLQTGKACPKCGTELHKKYSRKTRSWFIGCPSYPECDYTERIIENGQDPDINKPLDKACPTCSKPLIKRYSRKTRRTFIGCSGYPQCTYIENLVEELGNCPQCQKPLLKRFSPKTRRAFVGCSGYPECKYIERK